MKNFNKSTFIVSTIVFIFIIAFSYIAAFAEDEGTIGTNAILLTFAKLFYVLRFPTHTLFWNIIISGDSTIYFTGLFINCLFYSLITERIFSLFTVSKK